MSQLSEFARSPGRPLRKALVLLELLARANGPVPLSDLARRCAQPKSSVHRMLRVLADLELVARTDSGFVLGDYLSDITHHSERGKAERLRRLFNPLLIELQERTGGVVVMGVLSGLRVRYVEILYRHDLADFARRQPLLMPAHLTATGRALLAHRADLPHCAGEATTPVEGTPVEPAQLLTELRAVRTRGVSVLLDEAAHGGTAVAAPVHIAGQAPFVAIGVADPGRIHVPRAVTAVKRAADTAGALATTRLLGR